MIIIKYWTQEKRVRLVLRLKTPENPRFFSDENNNVTKVLQVGLYITLAYVKLFLQAIAKYLGYGPKEEDLRYIQHLSWIWNLFDDTPWHLMNGHHF